MPVGTDSWRRPVYIDRRNSRFFAEPLIGNGVWPEVSLTLGMFAAIPENTLVGRYGSAGTPTSLSADVAIDLINTATASTINAARIVAASTSSAGVVQLTDSTASTSTATAATPNSVKAAYDLANAALPKSGGTVTGALEIGATGSLVFEGSTDNAFELTVAAADPTADRTVTLPDATTTIAGLAVTQTFTAAQRGAITTLTSAATVTPDFAVGNNFALALGHNATLANPANLAAGQSGAIVITQGGSYTLSYGSQWKFVDGTPPTVATSAGKVSVLAYYVESASRIAAQMLVNVA
jgi:hypothetical protein